MLNYRLGTVNEKQWGFKPVFGCSKPHTFSTFSGQEKELRRAFLKLLTCTMSTFCIFMNAFIALYW